MNRTPFQVNSRADVARLIGIYQQQAPHRVPLLEGVYHSVISMAEVLRDGSAPLKALDRTGLPSLVLLGDDDGLDTGPAGWACARRLPYWAAGAIIHATGGRVEDYRSAVLMTVVARRMVMVETGTSRVMEWHRLFAKVGVPTLNLVPPNGGVHPIAVAREKMN